MKIAFAYDSRKGPIEKSASYLRCKAWADAMGAELVLHDVANTPLAGRQVDFAVLDELAD